MSAPEYTRVFSAGGRVAHLRPPWEPGPRVMCACGVPWYGWLGTGCQDEYDHAAKLRTCRACAKAAGFDPGAPLRVVMTDAPGP